MAKGHKTPGQAKAELGISCCKFVASLAGEARIVKIHAAPGLVLSLPVLSLMMPSSAEKPSRSVQFLVLVVGIFAISLGSILIRLAQNEAVPSLVIALWRMLLSTLILLPFTLAGRRDELGQMGRAKWGLAVLSGALLGLHFATWTSSLALTSITSSTVLVATAPLWVGLASPFLLDEPLSRALKLGIALAMVGTLVVSVGGVVALENGRIYLDLTGTGEATQPLLGNALALIGGITVAGYMIIGRRLRPASFSVELYDCCLWHGCDDIAAIQFDRRARFSGLQHYGLCVVSGDGFGSATTRTYLIQLGARFLARSVCVAGSYQRTGRGNYFGHAVFSRISRAVGDLWEYSNPERGLSGRAGPGLVQPNLLVTLPTIY